MLRSYIDPTLGVNDGISPNSILKLLAALFADHRDQLFPPLLRGPSVLSLVFEAVPFHGATEVVVIDIGALRTEVEISAPVARIVDIGFFHGGADP